MKEKQEYLTREETPIVNNRWMWVRRFIMCTALVTLLMQTLAPIYFDSEEIFTSDISINKENQKSHIVLHTGFPPAANVSGLAITPGKAAATAFSPNPAATSAKQIDTKHTLVGGEGWWDRLFPNRHVHLVSVQLPVTTFTKDVNATTVEANLSICASKKQSFGLGRPQVPDMDKCVETALVKSEAEDAEDLFGVLEWTPDVTIVLQKSKLYWLVVQAPAVPFLWVNSETGLNSYGTAFETEAGGWEFKLEGEPIPSAMVMVEDHHKD